MSAAAMRWARGRALLAASVASVGMAASVPAAAIAAPGDLITSFGGAAAPLTPGLAPAAEGARLNAVATQGDKVVAAGVRDGRMIVERFGADGLLDAGFGTGGTAFAGPGGTVARGLAVLADGRIVVAGERPGGGLVASRLQADGTLDGSFGNGGVATAIDDTTRRARAGRVVVRPEGKVLMTATATLPNSDAERATVVQWASNGALDGGFGNGGVAQLAAPGVASRGLGIALQPDGRAVVVGAARGSFGESLALAWRLRTDGSTDAAFNGNGTQVQNLGQNGGGFSELRSVAVRADGSIVAGGANTDGSSADALLVRMSTTGTLAGVTREAAAPPSGASQPFAGGFDVLSTRDHVYVGGGTDAQGGFRTLGLAAYTPATLAANAAFGGRTTADLRQALPFAPQSGHTYVAADSRASGGIFAGRQGQMTGIAQLADGRVAVSANVGTSPATLGTTGQGVVALFEGLPESAAPTVPVTPPTTPATPTTPTATAPTAPPVAPSAPTTPSVPGSPAASSTPSTVGPPTTPTPTAPRLSRVALRPRLITSKKKASLATTLTADARLRLGVDRRSTGREDSDGTCRKVSTRNRAGDRCTLWVRTGGVRIVARKAGSSTMRLGRRVTTRTLPSGSYRLTIVPTDRSGELRGRASTLGFRVARR